MKRERKENGKEVERKKVERKLKDNGKEKRMKKVIVGGRKDRGGARGKKRG